MNSAAVAGEGRTMWRRSALVLVPGLIAAGAMAVAMAEGVLAAGIGVSSDNFTIEGTDMTSTKLAAFTTSTKTANGDKGVILLSQESMSLHNMCMISKTDLPVLGTYSMILKSGQDGEPVQITNFVGNASALSGGTGVMNNAKVGQDASTLETVNGAQGKPGDFGLASDTFSLSSLKLDASSVAGGKFQLAGVDINLVRGEGKC